MVRACPEVNLSASLKSWEVPAPARKHGGHPLATTRVRGPSFVKAPRGQFLLSHVHIDGGDGLGRGGGRGLSRDGFSVPGVPGHNWGSTPKVKVLPF